MRVILALFPLVMILQEGFDFNLDLGARLSAKNVLLYLSLVIIGLRMAQQRRLRIEMPNIQLCFVILIGYAILSWWVASFIIQYDRYPIQANAIFLKILLVDRFLVFLAFFYGPRSVSEVMWVLKALLGVVILAHFVTVGESFGILPTDYVSQKGGRMNGVIGEANQYASFTALFLPALLAIAMSSRGAMRGIWAVGALLSAISFALAASRGALVGVIVSVLAGLYLFRNQLSPGAVARWMAIGGFVLMLGIVVTAMRYGDVLYARLVEDTLGFANLSDLSMGRTDVWTAALDKMLDQPITLLTGFGWRAYWSLPHALAPHNTYLDFWFNLGLPGLLSFVAIFAIALSSARRTAIQAPDEVRYQLTAFVFGIVCTAASIFFTEWYEPWTYFWPSSPKSRPHRGLRRRTAKRRSSRRRTWQRLQLRRKSHGQRPGLQRSRDFLALRIGQGFAADRNAPIVAAPRE